MNKNNLENILKTEPAYRLKQAKQLIFKDLIEDWQRATVFPFVLKEKLNKEYPLSIDGQKSASKDQKTIKALITLDDGLKIESVLMKHTGGRNTVCVSSQVGCKFNCSFCATGQNGFKRDLLPMEIVVQVLFFARELKKQGERASGVVFMGMGEPFGNTDNVLAAIRILNDEDGLNIGARHISISTVGLSGGIKKLAAEPLQINLAISLHASNNELRSKIIPLNKVYPLEMILKSATEYIAKTNRRVMFEYLMIKDLNDSLDQAQELVDLFKKFDLSLFLVNLITYNQTGIFEPSIPAKIKKFKEFLENHRIAVTERYRFGREIKGACGQLAAVG
ncbi:MAG: 23S rRNA (adenine(2503)-C(2))-methyltransferase RlmN [Candidatus Parcubacteria bacterium]|nr:23S rRNA (adenine(2503)-C(2))-methyltransferase RlmN [Candidatus Parcubacteria bacterium]